MVQPALKRTTELVESKETPNEPSLVYSHRLVRLAEKMHDKGYRDGYVAAHNRQVLAKQMREFRGEKSQTDFAQKIDKRQTIVSRLENPNYSGWTLGTLFEIASKLDVAVFVRFVDFPTFLKYTGNQSESALHPAQYDQQQVDDFARYATQSEVTLDDIKRTLKILRRPLSEPETEKKPQSSLSRLFSEETAKAADQRIDRSDNIWMEIPTSGPKASTDFQWPRRGLVDSPHGLASWS